ncbi:MAG TPA: glycosyltransferase family 1 protein [Longimicrobiales bacterium]|nr:glycosyltransferase family 1 protein [Longimicrobiales bacterium]
MKPYRPLRVHFDFQVFAIQTYGGISRYFSELVRRLDRHGVDARIIAPLHINGYLRDLPNVSGVCVPRVRRTGRLRQFANAIASRTLPQHADIVHETYYSSSAFLRARTARVITVYDMIHERFSAELAHDPLSARKRDAVQRADHVICISETTRRDLIEILGVAPDRTSVVHLAASLPEPAGRSVIPDGDPFLLHVGERGGYKNFDRLLTVFAQTPGFARSFRLVCFGGPAFTAAELERQRAIGVEPGRVLHVGGDDTVLAALYARATALVYPSLYEGFGIPPLEAMVAGCPVICSTGGSIPEIVADAGEYFDPRDEDSLARAITRVIESPERTRELQQLGARRSSLFTWERCARQTARVYETLAARTGRAAPAIDAMPTHAHDTLARPPASA